MLSTLLELLCLTLATLLLIFIWPPLGLLPWVAATGWAAWLVGGWGRPVDGGGQ